MKHRRRSSVTCRLEVVVLGAGEVGKTCLIRRLLKEDFLEQYIPTVQDSYETIVELDEVCINAQIIDTAGNYEFPAMRRVAVANADAIILVYSVDKPGSLNELEQLQPELPKCKSNGKAVPVIVVANKTDLPSYELQPSEESTIELNESQYPHIAASAKTELNVFQLWKCLKEQLYAKPRKTSSSLRGKLTKAKSFFKSDTKEVGCD